MGYQDLNDFEGLQFIPVNEYKQPLAKNWQKEIKKYDLSNCWGVGLVCGIPSGNLECIDIDCKYDLTKKLYKNYKSLIHSIDPNLLEKLVVQETKSKGYHFIYRCEAVGGNAKLANRNTTEEERLETYQTAYKKKIEEGVDEAIARNFAKKEQDNDNVRVLIETRGRGGQFVVNPSPHYKFVYGDLSSITEITPEEREVLLSAARQFNEYYEVVADPTPKSKKEKTQGTSSFDDYNQRGDICDLLQSHGWKLVKRKGQKTHFLRPGQSTAQTSGNFDHDKNWFSVFTTSTEFEPMKAYLPYAVYAKLECNGDYSEASKRLYDLGYGSKPEVVQKEKPQSTRVIASRIDVTTEDGVKYRATPEDYDGYLQSVRDGTLKRGLTTGSQKLDEHFLFKQGNVVMVNGLDNVGKSEFVWWLELIAAMYHGWKGIIFSSENTLGAFMRRMIQMFWGKPLHGELAMSQKEFQFAKSFIEKHFLLIRAQEQLFNYKDIINLMKIYNDKGEYHYGMIDPYNSLKTDLSGFSKLSTHEYHYEALSEIKSFGQSRNFGWFINNHAVTAALRQKDADRQYPVAPRKEDTEGGGKFSNKADDFFTIHRITQHPANWMVTEVHVRKIKDTETGGRPTPHNEPVLFSRYTGHAYREGSKDTGFGVDPIAEWHYERKSLQRPVEIKKTQTWIPYADDVDFKDFEDSNDTDAGF